jgi:myo-inositol-1(or 4)-monophosphatase
VEAKPGKQNLVTEYDHAAEKLIVETILKRFPDHSIIAEESGSKQSGKSKVCWIIDPMDGTVNFAHNIPFFAVSIAISVEDTVQAGIIYQPITDELFIAEKGKGTYFNKSKAAVSRVPKLEDAIVAGGFPYQFDNKEAKYIKNIEKIAMLGSPFRYLGSAVLNLAYLAAGRFDAYWGISLEPWDIAAGKLIVEEAGGKVTNYKGGPIGPFDRSSLLASNGKLHKELMEHLCS